MTYTEAQLRTIKQIKAAARAVVTLSSGLVCGAQQVRGSVSMLPPELRFSHPAVDALLQALPDSTPMGESRLYVAEQRLLDSDAALMCAESAHRQAVLRECKAIYFACCEIQRNHCPDVVSNPGADAAPRQRSGRG
jgi:hypothetical protein